MSSPARIEELQKKFAESPRRFFAPLANEYRKAGNAQKAIEICRENLAQQPNHMSGQVVLGQALFDAGMMGEASLAFEAALALDPENLIALRHLGDIYRNAGDLSAARSWYSQVLDVDPRNHEVITILREIDDLMQAESAIAEDMKPRRAGAVTPTTSFEGAWTAPVPSDLRVEAVEQEGEHVAHDAVPEADGMEPEAASASLELELSPEVHMDISDDAGAAEMSISDYEAAPAAAMTAEPQQTPPGIPAHDAAPEAGIAQAEAAAPQSGVSAAEGFWSEPEVEPGAPAFELTAPEVEPQSAASEARQQDSAPVQSSDPAQMELQHAEPQREQAQVSEEAQRPAEAVTAEAVTEESQMAESAETAIESEVQSAAPVSEVPQVEDAAQVAETEPHPEPHPEPAITETAAAEFDDALAWELEILGTDMAPGSQSEMDAEWDAPAAEEPQHDTTELLNEALSSAALDVEMMQEYFAPDVYGDESGETEGAEPVAAADAPGSHDAGAHASHTAPDAPNNEVAPVRAEASESAASEPEPVPIVADAAHVTEAEGSGEAPTLAADEAAILAAEEELLSVSEELAPQADAATWHAAAAEASDESGSVEGAPAVFITETMAGIYERQGYLEMAAAVYRQLLESSPENARLRAKLGELEARMSPAEASTPSRARGQAQNAERSARMFFSSLAKVKLRPRLARPYVPGRSDSPAASASQEDHGLPAREAGSELSLERVFRNGGSQSGSAVSGNASFSFDQFFAGGTVGAAGTAERPVRQKRGDETDEIEQFNAWLEGLKKS